MKIKCTILFFVASWVWINTVHADDIKQKLPDFSLYSDRDNKKKNEALVPPPENNIGVANNDDQSLHIKTQEVPKYVLDMMREKNVDLGSLANSEANRQIALEKKELSDDVQKKLQQEKLLKDREEKIALLKKQKQEEEMMRKDKLLAEQYRVFEHRPQYDYRSIEKLDSVHKQVYGPNNQHLPPFIDSHQYSRYLFIAAIEDDVLAMNDLLKKGADINGSDVKNGYTTLMYAVRDNKMKSVIYLINKGADLNVVNHNNRSALHLAMVANNIEAIEVLLKMQPDVEIKDSNNRHAAIYFPNMPDSIAMKVVDLYRDPSLALLDFAEIGRFVAVQEAIKRGANIDVQDGYGNTALMLAVKRGDLQLLSLLLQKKPNINLMNKDGEDALLISQRIGDEYIWSLLKTYINKEEIKGYMGDEINTLQPANKPISLLPKE